MFRASLALLLSLGPAGVAAQDAPSAAVMAVGGTVGVEAAAWVEAVEAIEARLREASFRVDDSGLPRRDDCAAIECLRAERASRDVDVLVTLTLFVAEGTTDQVGSIVVTMVDREGQYVGDELVDGRITSTVAALALAEARSQRERGGAPWLHVTGTTGSIVRVDGREVGVVPYEGALTPGHHRIELSLGGYEAVTREVDASTGQTVNIDETLRAGSNAGSGGDGVTGGVLIGVGAAVIAAGAVTLGLGASFNAASGDCVRPPTPRCIDYVPPGAGDGHLAGGGVALGVGVGLVVVGVLVLAID